MPALTFCAVASARANIRREANGICARCFGPLEPVYDWDELARVVSRESIEAGPRSLWRYNALLPGRAAGGRGERARASRRSSRRRGSRRRSASARCG